VKWDGKGTNDTRLTAVVYIHQIAVQVDVFIASYLHRCIGRLGGFGAGREGELCEEGVRRKGDLGDGLCGEVTWVRRDDDLLNGRMRGLRPVRSKRCHFEFLRWFC
jgi:hypothetical protein